MCMPSGSAGGRILFSPFLALFCVCVLFVCLFCLCFLAFLCLSFFVFVFVCLFHVVGAEERRRCACQVGAGAVTSGGAAKSLTEPTFLPIPNFWEG